MTIQDMTPETAVAKPLPTWLDHIQSPGRVFVAGVGLGVASNILLMGHPVGLGLLLFVLLTLVVLWRVGYLEKLPVAWPNAWLALPLLFFAGMTAVRTNGFLVTLNSLAVLFLLAYWAFFYGNGRVTGLGLIDTVFLPWRVASRSTVMAAPVVLSRVNTDTVREQGQRSLFPILRGLLIALPILILFTLLLASADLIFADYLENLVNWNFLDSLGEWIWRGFWMLVVAWLAIGGLALALIRRVEDHDQGLLDLALQRLPTAVSLGFIESTIILLLVNTLFSSFVSIQFTYLFGGRQNINLEGYTFADYARRGFFELVAVAVLSLALIIGLNWITRRAAKSQIRLFNVLGSLMIGFVLVMLVSAWRRMALYEATYGYTELRLLVYVFMAWLALVLGWFLLTLWLRPDHFAIGVLVAAMGFLATLNLLNPDAFIARQNLDRYALSGDLDATYLTTLSNDAVPQLVRGLALTAGDSEEQVTPACSRDYYWSDTPDCYATPYEILQADLNGRITRLTTHSDWQNWAAFNLSRWQTYRLLQFMAPQTEEKIES